MNKTMKRIILAAGVVWLSVDTLAFMILSLIAVNMFGWFIAIPIILIFIGALLTIINKFDKVYDFKQEEEIIKQQEQIDIEIENLDKE